MRVWLLKKILTEKQRGLIYFLLIDEGYRMASTDNQEFARRTFELAQLFKPEYMT